MYLPLIPMETVCDLERLVAQFRQLQIIDLASNLGICECPHRQIRQRVHQTLAVIQLTQDGNGLFKIICTLNDLAELVAHDAQEIHCLRNAAPVLLLSKEG
jgi:hypothetical protein